MLFFDSDVEQSYFSLLLHLFKKNVHWIMRNTHQSLYHHIIHKFNEVGQSLSISIGYLQKIYLLLFLSSFQIHRFLLDLLPKFHLIFVLNIFQVALLVNLVLNLTNNNCHFIGNDALILAVSYFSSLILFVIELCLHVPGFVITDLVENGFVLP